jgi:hypothetical protein
MRPSATSPWPRTAQAPSQKSRRIAVSVAIAAAVISVLALWTADHRAERGAIEQLPAQDRRALYERTLHTLRSSCDPRTLPDGLGDFCREQAEFVTQFPECDAACRALAKAHESKPTR